MKAVLSFLGAAAVVLLVLAGCQTTKPVSPQESMIQTDSAGFSPKADKGRNTIEFSLTFGNREIVNSWKVQIAADKDAVRTFTGDSGNLPPTLTWDGMNDSNNAAPEGTYTARLSVDYAGKVPVSSASSKSFVLDTTEPTGTLSADPTGFTPVSQGVKGPVTISVSASSPLAKIQSWGVDIFDPDGKLFQSFTGKGADGKMSWDGKGLAGDWVQPSRTYAALATIRDEYGLAGTARLAIPVADGPAATAQQPPPQKVQPGQSAVQLSLTGFSPLATTGPKSIGLGLTFGNPGAVKSWKLTIDHPDRGTQKSWSGDGNNLPKLETWEGETDAGGTAPDGAYTAGLAVDYGPTADPVRVTSRSFVLDITPPTGSIALSVPLFSPIESSDTVTLSVKATSPTASIDGWSMDIYDPGNNVFKSFSGKWPVAQAVWNGKGTSGEMVLSAEDYPVTVKVRDEFGNQGVITGNVPVDILVERTPNGFRILSSRIFFKAFTADYRNVAADLEKQNVARLDALAEKLKKFPGYKIRIVGHAVSIHWDNPALGKVEQETILIPLSKARADAVMHALTARGLDAGRFTTDGVGAADQLVPDSNRSQRWQNRRVALYLER
jgi:outer membrane protein OmpA-like peptidoglycan-associated protein